MTVTPAMFEPLRAAVGRHLINRDVEVEVMNIALLSKSHVFLLSEPGTAKSMLVNLYASLIGGARTYTALFNKFADDTLLFGPWALSGLRQDRRLRAGDGYLQTAHFAFWDEGWKGSSALINSALKALNERKFDDDGQEKDIPLCTVVLASNELPQQQHSELEAMYDRIEFRLVVEPLRDPADIMAMLQLSKPDPNPTPVLDWADVEAAQAEVAQMPVTPAADEALVRIVDELRRVGVTPSPRRIVRARAIGQAAAWMAGDDKVEPGHLDVLAHVFWHDPEQRAAVSRIVYDVTSPLRAEALELSDAVAGLAKQMDDAKQLDPDDPQRGAVAVECIKKLKKAALDAVALEAKATGRDASVMADVARRVNLLGDELQKENFGVGSAQDFMDLARTGKF